MNRRAFIQGLIGLASMPVLSKYINVFRPSAVREGITKAADNTMQQGIEFYEAVIKRVMDEGTVVSESDRVRTYKHPDKPEIDVEVNLTSGDTSVNFESDYGFKAGADITTDMDLYPRAPKELTEGELVYRGHGPDGDYSKDWEEGIIEGGITNLEDWIKRKRGYAAGGRVGMWRGGVPKGLQAAMRAIMSKYGDDAITTADRAPQPEKTIQEQIMDFNARNPSNLTETVQIWEDPVKIRAAVDDIFPTGDYKYDAQMAAEALVENNPEVFNNMLYDDLDQRTQMKIYGAVVDVVMGNMAKMREMKKLSKPTNTLAAMKAGKGINMSDPVIAEEFTRFMKENDPKGFKDIEEKVELMNFNPKGRKKNADGGSVDGDVSLTVIEIPDISKSGVESLFKRR